MTADDGRDAKRRVVTGRDWTGADRHLVLQEVNGYIAIKADTVYLDPLAISRTIEHLRDLQAHALQGVRWNI